MGVNVRVDDYSSDSSTGTGYPAQSPVKQQQKLSRKQKRQKVAADRAAIEAQRKNKKVTRVKGVSDFLFIDAIDYDFIQWVEKVRNWAQRIDSWIENQSDIWKDSHRSKLLSSVHRLDWLAESHLQGGGSNHRKDYDPLHKKYDYIPSSSSRSSNGKGQLHSHTDASAAHAASIVTSTAVFDLCELLLARSDICIDVMVSVPPNNKNPYPYPDACAYDYDYDTANVQTQTQTPPGDTTGKEGIGDLDEEKKVDRDRDRDRDRENLKNSKNSPSLILSHTLTLDSVLTEKHLGVHPYSHTALFLLQNRLKGGRMAVINAQANQTRAGADPK